MPKEGIRTGKPLQEYASEFIQSSGMRDECGFGLTDFGNSDQTRDNGKVNENCRDYRDYIGII